ncbi:MAG: TrkH family potassium uptake protein [Candidatus Nanohaloarchaea archaeon]
MRGEVLAAILGSFLKVFTAVIALPIPVGLYYGESFLALTGFLYASIASLILGVSLGRIGDYEEPSVSEAMVSTVMGWSLAIVLGAIPFLVEVGLTNAVFESTAGLTTTGISMFLEPQALNPSLLFWRALMQWVGGLGVLTFFIAVIRESGGISRKLFSAETHKTDPGSIRPSLKKSIIELWKVYIFITGVMVASYSMLGMNFFNAVAHAFSAISTGGFSTTGASIAAFGTPIQAVTVVFMLLGGVNFVLLYKALNLDSSIFDNSEFRLYIKIFVAFSALIFLDLSRSGLAAGNVLDSLFQSASVLSSTGYGTMSIMSLSVFVQFMLIGLMFVGGSLGSTSGGIKTFRLKALIELTRTRLRSYSLPSTAINEVKIDGEILDNSMLHTISVLLFTWIGVVFAATGLLMLLEDVSFMGALSGTVSAVGNMGPVYMEGAEMVNLSIPAKMVWVVVMIAGRLEMLPVLAIFNRKVLSS